MNYRQAQQEIIKIIRSLSPKYGVHNVFRDFITLAACTISNSVDKQQWQKREDQYMRTIRKYQKDEADKFAEMFALVVAGLSGAKMGDFMGELYMQLEISNKNSGQFFTPYDVSKMMAEMIQPEKDKNGIVTLNEPAVGAGAMIIAYAEIMKLQGLNYQTQLKVVCNDVDYDVVKMCYIQLSLLGIDAVVMQGDSITTKMNEYWFTPMRVMNIVRSQQQKDNDKTKEMYQAMRNLMALEKKKPLEKPIQLSLFEEDI